MSPLVAAATVAAMTTIGRWARGKSLTIDTVVGLVGVALGLAILEQANAKFARGFATLIVIGVAVAHLPVIVDQSGLTGKKLSPSTLPEVQRPGQQSTLPGIGRPRQ